MLMFPDASIPIVEMSVIKNDNPEEHIKIGIILQSLRSQNILIIGSGASFHNFSGIMSNEKKWNQRSK